MCPKKKKGSEASKREPMETQSNMLTTKVGECSQWHKSMAIP